MDRKNSFRLFWVLLVLLGFVTLLLADHLMAQSPAKGKYDALKRKYVKGEYREPRFPSYLKPPKSIDDVMPFARAAVRQVGGRTPLGLVNPGQTVLLIIEPRSEEILLQAIQKAYEERGVKVQYLPGYEAAGVSKEDAVALHDTKEWVGENHIGYMEADTWFGKWVDKTVPQEWLKSRRPDLYDAMYKAHPMTSHLQEIEKKLDRGNVAKGIIKYLDAHPEVNALFWGSGGRTATRRLLQHHEAKFYSNFIFDRRHMLISRVPAFPGDLWRLIEERSVEPIAWVDRVHVTDPEGTDLVWDLSQKDAESWARGIYQQGHIYMIPDMATGRFPYSIIDYPAIVEKEYLPALQSELNGVVAGTSNHAGMYPRIEVRRENGYITEIKDGGIYGEIWREFFKNYPKLDTKTIQYPYLKKPGYWWMHEGGMGTNPKFYLAKGDHSGERNHSGVIHWGTGLRVYHDPKKPLVPEGWFDWAEKEKVPADHWMHVHNVFVTYRVKIRGADKWLNIVNKGRLTALDDPIVRALASRYGDPDDLLGDDWVPHIPGINAPGSYAEYAKDPLKFYMENVAGKVEKGTYEYFYTPPSMRKKK